MKPTACVMLFALVVVGARAADPAPRNFDALPVDPNSGQILGPGDSADFSKNAAIHFKMCPGWKPYTWHRELLVVCPGVNPPFDAIPLVPAPGARA